MRDLLQEHLEQGATTLCRCWALERRDGVRLGFTDHDRDLGFEGWQFAARAGLTPQAIEQSTGLAVDTTEAMGALSGFSLEEADIEAGRYDDAALWHWLVNWADPEARRLLFRGSLGTIRREGALFRADVQGLSEALNRPVGRVYQAPCSAVLGDAACGVDLDAPGYVWDGPVAGMDGAARLRLGALDGFEAGWFTYGVLDVLSGPATGSSQSVSADLGTGEDRLIELWSAPRGGLVPGDRVRLRAGCDKRPETCRAKFDNFLNFRGFPHIPGEDWLMSYPGEGGGFDGGSMNR